MGDVSDVGKVFEPATTYFLAVYKKGPRQHIFFWWSFKVRSRTSQPIHHYQGGDVELHTLRKIALLSSLHGVK